MTQINSDTQFCISLAARPGSFGNRFHNYLYGELHLNFVYRSGTTTDLKAAVAGLRALRIRGCGLSMPFKQRVLELLDEVDPVAREIGAVNTIVNEDVQGVGRLVGYNTDFVGVRNLLKMRSVGPGFRVGVLGSGGMARAVVHALQDLACRDVTLLARDRAQGEALASRYDFNWAQPDLVKAGDFEVLINATPIGMLPDSADRLPFTAEVIQSSKVVVESVAYPPETALLRIARETGLRTVSGFEITLAQGVEQFRLYTGVSLRPDQVARAAVYARHTK